jgi:hypothetical protein
VTGPLEVEHLYTAWVVDSTSSMEVTFTANDGEHTRVGGGHG